MRLDQIQLAIRPRTALECLDISFMFCRHHCVGLMLASSIAVLPIAIFNSFVFSLHETNPYAEYLLLSMEIPWAMMFVTLYLGQITFSRKPSYYRMFFDAISAVPSMILFQLIIRGLCIGLFILVPVAFVGMYYMNEIILLEKTSILKTWSRRTAINSRSLGKILSLRCFDLGILLGGTWALERLFHAVSALWDDRQHWMPILSEDEPVFLDSSEFIVVWDWQLQTAFWFVIVFLTVFRFVTYLDCRIRREGWDVELKLRAQASMYGQKELLA